MEQDFKSDSHACDIEPSRAPEENCTWLMMLGDSNTRMVYFEVLALIEGLGGGLRLRWPTGPQEAAEMARYCNGTECSRHVDPRWFDREAIFSIGRAHCLRLSTRFMHTQGACARVTPFSRRGRMCSGLSRGWPAGSEHCDNASEYPGLRHWQMPSSPDVLWLSHGLWGRANHKNVCSA